MTEVISFVFSMVEAAVMIGIPGSVLPGRYSKPIKWLLTIIAVVIGAIGINVIGENTCLRILVSLILFGILCFTLYRSPIQITLFYLFFAQYICVVSEMILSDIVILLPSNRLDLLLNNMVIEGLVSVLVKALVIVAGIVFVHYINKLHPHLPTGYWIVLDIILIIIIEGLQVISVLEEALQTAKSNYLSYASLLSYVLILLGAFLIYFFGKICWIYEKQTNFEMAELRRNELQKIVTYQEQTSLEIKKMRHDINKHLTNLSYMLDLNQVDEAIVYISTLTDRIDMVKQNPYSGNYIIDAILNKHVAVCKSKNIELRLLIDEISYCDINPVDISAILDNLLDNAVEAVEKLFHSRKRYIEMKLFCYKDNLTVIIINPFDGKIKEKGEEIYTSKIDYEEHGYGMKSVRDAVKRTHGVLKYYVKEREFVVVFMIPKIKIS